MQDSKASQTTTSSAVPLRRGKQSICNQRKEFIEFGSLDRQSGNLIGGPDLSKCLVDPDH